ncbi:MAG: cupin domain-containing protein [Deltaproteobacteria bacterium]|nr:cupin domain-containing protein [Deltaproteobacteria bacterium]
MPDEKRDTHCSSSSNPSPAASPEAAARSHDEQATIPGDGRLPLALAVPLAKLIDVVPGAVVSRTLARSKGGTITLFAMDRGQALSEHSAPFDAFVQVLQGEVEITIGPRPVRAHAGEAVMMPADVPHALTAIEPLVMLLVMIREPR